MLNLTPYTRKHSDAALYNPFRELEDLERSFWGDQALDAFKTDIQDTGSEYLLEADLPGFRKEDIHADLHDGFLTIRAERHSDYEEKDQKGRFLKCERSYGSFSRSFDMSGIDTEHIKAAYTDGVLRLTLPKQTQQPENSRRLEIE